MLPEIQLSDGLPVLSTRKVVVDEKGTLLIATDAGLHIAPSFNTAYQKIQSQMQNLQIWDLLIQDSLLFTATYNKGLFVFNRNTGNLITLFPYNYLPKIRRLRVLDNKIYCITSLGVFEINKLTPKLIFYTRSILDEDGIPVKPMDIFIRNNQLHVISYGYDGLWQQQAAGVWRDVTKTVKSKIKNKENLIENYAFPSLTATEINGNIFIGGVNEYVVWDKNDEVVCYQIKHKPEESYAIWDWVQTGNHIYAATANVDNFKTGGLILHNSKITLIDPPQWNQSVWSCTYDPINSKLWIATNTGGIFLQNNRFQNIPDPFPQGQKKVINNIVYCWNKDTLLYYNSENHHQVSFQTLTIPERIWDVFTADNYIYIIGRVGIYKIPFNHPNGAIPVKVQESLHAQSTLSIGHRHWLFPMYTPLALYNSKTNTLKKFPFLHMADAMAVNRKFGIYHSIEKGFFITQGDTVYPLKTTGKIPHFFYANFAITAEHLLLNHANSLILFKIDPIKKSLIFLHQFSLTEQFRGFNIVKLQSTEHSFLLQTPTHVLELDVIEQNNLRIKNQIYLGNYRKTELLPTFNSQQFLSRGNEIQKFALQQNEVSPFNYLIFSNNINNKPTKFVTKLNEAQNYQITIAGSDYLKHNRYVYTLRLFNLNSMSQYQYYFIGGNRFWINSLDRGRYIATLQNLNQHVSTLWISVVDYYFDVPFYLMLFLLVLFTMGAYFNIKQSRISVQRRIAILRLQTLRLNFNPHFIYNSMGLIQSLIVQNNTKKAVDVTARLARLNRVFLSNSTKDLIGLDEEMRFIKDYVDMEQLRFEDDNELRVVISLPSRTDLSQWLMPPLILQPLVENAIKHGLLPSKKRGEISIEVVKIDVATITIRITNPVPKSRSKSQSTGMGNKLVSDRIEVFNSLYKPNYQASFRNFTTEENNYVAELLLFKSEVTPPPKKELN
jgi:two-component sensor histidine kinase